MRLWRLAKREPMPDRVFRLANPSELGALAAFVNQAYRGDSSRSGWTTEADYLDGTRTAPHLLEPFCHREELWVFERESDGRFVGCFCLARAQKTAELGMLTIDPSQQNMGLGREMLTRAEELSIQAGCTSLKISVISLRRELIAYYERRGFYDTGQRIAFPASDPAYGQPKQPLQLIVMEKSLRT
jgi:ribosomal protein S18 acetylase RimI-like enzyme